MGTRTAFDHGTSLTGTATTEYIPILKHVIGLNNKLFIENRSYKLQPTEPIKVETLNDKTMDAYYEAMYGEGGAMEIPRHLNWYAVYLHNEKILNSLDQSVYGNFRVDQVLHTALANHVLGKPLINYSYKPQN